MSHEKNLEIGLLLDYYKGFLTDNQKKVLDYYYNEDYSLSEIAAQLGISRQGAQDNIARSQKKLLDMEQKLGLLKKTTASARFPGQGRAWGPAATAQTDLGGQRWHLMA